MRVIGGVAKGRRLPAEVGGGVRPTSDLVRGAIFTMLEARLGGVDGLRFADLCCGTGALGVEALSRGAASCAFVDQADRSLRAARANVAATGLGPATFTRADVLRWAAQQGPASYDVVLCDPPYAWAAWDELQAALAEVAEVLVAEAADEVAAAAGWACRRAKRHGGTVVTMLVREGSEALGTPTGGATG